MNPNEALPDQQSIWCDPRQAYIQMLVDTFCFHLSPQELPRNTTAKLYMDQELWMPIRVLAKLPELDNLLISDVMFPFVTQTLYNCASHYLEVDVTREIIRPRWALRSSVFISNVDMYATTDQVCNLLEEIRSSETHPNNPFESDNISISKQTANSWSISFKSPSAGPYAAMAMKSKCINGSLVLPMACVHINPPRVAYSNASIVVMEVDAIQYGDPVIPVGYMQYFSEDPSHMNLLHSSMNRQGPPQHESVNGPVIAPFMAPAFRERSYSSQSLCTQPSVGQGNDIERDSLFQTPQADDQVEYGSHSSANLGSISAHRETKNESEDIAQKHVVASSQLDRGTAEQENQGVVNPDEPLLGTQPQPITKLPNPTPSHDASHDIEAVVPDNVEPKVVAKAGEHKAPPTFVTSPETKLHSPSPQKAVDIRKVLTVKTSEDVEGARDEKIEDFSKIPYPTPESLHAPSFANLVHLNSSSSKVQNEEQMQKRAIAPRQNRSTQMSGSPNPNSNLSAIPDRAMATRKERREWRVNDREYFDERRNGKARNRHSPQNYRKHLRKGPGGSPNGQRDPDSTSNDSGPRRRNGQTKKPRNRGQRSNTENQQRNVHYNGERRDCHQDVSNALRRETAGDTNLPSEQKTGSRTQDWQTISYKRLGPRQSQRSYSASEGSSRDGGRQNEKRQDVRLRSSSSQP